MLFIFGDDVDGATACKDKYKNPRPAVAEPQYDPELVGLLEELAVSDQGNASDLEQWKKVAKRQAADHLSRRREEAQRRRMGSAKAKASGKRTRVWGQGRPKAKARASAKPSGCGPAAPPPAAGSEPDVGGSGGGTLVPGPTPVTPRPVAPPSDVAGGEPAGDGPAGGGGSAPVGGGGGGAAAGSAGPSAATGAAPAHRAQEGRAFVATGGWEVVQIEGGWLPYNGIRDPPRLDAHCQWHRGCKMDRVLHKSPIGLVAAWLAGGNVEKHSHERVKATLSSEAGHMDRTLHRQFFMDSATLEGGVAAAVVLREFELVGHNDGPEAISCPPRRAGFQW